MGPRWCRSCSTSKASWVPGMRTVRVPQTQFLIVVDWLELDKLKQEASSGRWGRRMVTTACQQHGLLEGAALVGATWRKTWLLQVAEVSGTMTSAVF